MRKVIRRYFDYDDSTGEVVRSDEYQLQNSLMMKNSNRRFIKSFIESYPEYTKDAYLGYFTKLMRCLEQNTNRLVIFNDETKRWLTNQPMTNSEMKELLDVSRTTIFRFLSESKDKGIIKKVKTEEGEVYYVNPVYCCNGNGVSPELYLIFEGDALLEQHLSMSDKRIIAEYLGVFRNEKH